MRAFVTGGTGFIGSHLVIDLAARGWEVVCAVQNHMWNNLPGIRCVQSDLPEPQSFAFESKEIGAVDVIFHLGAALPKHMLSPDVFAYLTAYTLATIRLLQLAEVDRKRATAEVGYRPNVPLEEGLEEYIYFIASGVPAPGWVRRA